MNKLKSILAITCSVFVLGTMLTGCGNDTKSSGSDNSSSQAEANENKNESSAGKKKKKKAAEELIGTWCLPGGESGYTFNDDNTGTYSDENGETKDFSYTESHYFLSITFNDDTELETDYSISDDKLIMKDNSGEEKVYDKQ